MAKSKDDSLSRFEPKQTQPSLTIPDQSMTIRQILDRSIAGSVSYETHPVYYDNVDDFDAVDVTLSPDFDFSDYIAEKQALMKKPEPTIPDEGGKTKGGEPTKEGEATEEGKA